MKFNFRKITSVLASAVMLGSTVGIASAASYPAPFVTSSGADVAIVVGANAPLDMSAAFDIGYNLQYELGKATLTGSTTTGSGFTTVGGDSVKIESTSQKLNIGTNLTTARPTKITNDANDGMPSLLAKKTYRSYDSQTYDYEQEVTIAPGITFALFQDSDYKDSTPTLGIHLPNSATPILNYTITFVTAPESDVNTAGRLEDFENTKLTILGKEYTLLNAYNSTGKLELMSGAQTATVTLNEEKPVPVKLADGTSKDYIVKLVFVDASTAKLEVNGESTGSLAKGGTFKLQDGTQVGIRDISYQAFAGGVMSAEISLGAEKLTLQDGAVVKLNDKTTGMNGLTAYISRSTSGTRQTITAITIAWTTDDEVFITPDKELLMPGFGSLKFTLTNITTPDKEVTKVGFDGDSSVQIVAPLKDGTSTFDVLGGNGTTFTKIGKYVSSGAGNLKTSSTSELIFDSDDDKYFIASWNSSTDAESYLLDAKTSLGDNSINQTTIRILVDGNTVEKGPYRASQTVSIGSNIVLTINTIDYAGHKVNVTGSSGVSFSRMFTKDGLMMNLPIDSISAGMDNLNVTGTDDLPTTKQLRFWEMDKYGTVAAGEKFNVTVGWTSDGKVQVSNIQGPFVAENGATSNTNYRETYSGSQKYIAYVKSALGSMLTYDKSGTQDVAQIEYHKGETYGNLWIASPEVTVNGDGGSTPGSPAGYKELGNIVVKDSDVTQGYAPNLIVIGGSCINTIAAKMLGSDTALCGSDFTDKAKVGAGQFLIKVDKSPVNANKMAMLVAGYELADTAKAALFVRTNHPTTDLGTADVVKTTAEVASSV